MKTFWSVLLAMVVMLVQAIGGSLPASLLLDRANPLREPLGTLSVTLTALLLVYLIRRFLYGRPWAALGWRNPSRVLLGVLAGAVPVLAAKGLSLAVGESTWVSADPSLYAGVPLVAVVILLGQAFPEELLWRGHLFDTLSGRLSPRTVMIILSVGFGAMHIISGGGGNTVTERLLYVVMATALGFSCTAARVRGGGLWMAVGVHLGFHLGLRVLPVQPAHLGVLLILMAITLTLAGAALLRGHLGGHGLISPDPQASKGVAA
ncbi:CPBP family intramembrane glutamic endopeptidase [Nonomuraea helvata]|uniref:Type II CAAX endopeptidase family protein n=1 Tax=Nonomuraea helvata TaxID=37484 RepID=A0ABV5SMD7_9ACTN